MRDGETLPGADSCNQLLTLTLGAALSEFLRIEAAHRALDPADLARKLLMRGIHQQRLDDVINELCPGSGVQPPSSEALLAARLEAGAMLGAFAGDALPLPGCPPATSCNATRDLLERVRSQRNV